MVLLTPFLVGKPLPWHDPRHTVQRHGVWRAKKTRTEFNSPNLDLLVAGSCLEPSSTLVQLSWVQQKFNKLIFSLKPRKGGKNIWTNRVSGLWRHSLF
jgi:hypothetical protein